MSVVFLTRTNEIHVGEFKFSFGSFLTPCGFIMSPKFKNLIAFKGNMDAIKCPACKKYMSKKHYSSTKNLLGKEKIQNIDFINKTGSRYWEYRNLSSRNSTESNRYYDDYHKSAKI